MELNKVNYEELLKKHNLKPEFQGHIGTGWVPFVDKLFSDIKALGWDCNLVQLKEKFGGLRVYTAEVSDEINKLIHALETESFFICEVCGKEGLHQRVTEKPSHYLIKTLCEPCHKIVKLAYESNDLKLIQKIFDEEHNQSFLSRIKEREK